MAGLSSKCVCPTCRAELTTFQQRAEGVCDRAECRGPWLQRTAQQHRQQKREQRKVFHARVREFLKQEHPEALDDGRLLLVVPHFASRLAEQPAERKQQFLARLEASLVEAQEIAANPRKSAQLRMEFPSGAVQKPPPLPVINACSTCQGECCRNGIDHAFLTPQFLAWRLVTDGEPAKSAADLLADYRARLPAESYDGSCMYHAAQGCVLPRLERSFTCNQFLCTGIVEHDASLQAAPEQPSTAVAVTPHDEMMRIGVMDSSGNRAELACDRQLL